MIRNTKINLLALTVSFQTQGYEYIPHDLQYIWLNVLYKEDIAVDSNFFEVKYIKKTKP